MTTRFLPSRPSTSVVFALALVATGLAGCAGNRKSMDAQADFPDVHAERHPIVIGDVAKSIDVFLAGNAGLDRRQKFDVREFARDYRQAGKGSLVITTPPGAPAGAVQHTVSQVRSVLTGEGVPAGQVRVVSGATHPTAASVRLSYSALDAKVVSQCGQWPHDMAGGSTTQSWANKPYYNLGCANQTMMAAQVADPIDHIRSRAAEEGDIGKRLSDIEKIRDGEDPSTKWSTSTEKINKAF